MQSWPSTLPQIPYLDFDTEQVSGLAQADESNNPYRTRTYPESEGTFQFKQLTVTQWQTLRTFYDVALNQCAPFSAPWLPTCGYDHHFARFTEAPTAAKNEKSWDATIKIEIISGVPMDGTDIAYWVD